jgi:hypothetical protein
VDRRVAGALAAIAVAFLLLATGYSLVTPPGEGPDEPGHIAYVQFLQTEHRLPRHGEVAEPLTHQVKHPPLYYGLGALWTAWADFGGLAFPPDPQFAVNLEHMDVFSAFRHVPEEHWPWAPRFLAVRWLRLLSVLLGLVTVLATFATARAVLPNEPWLAVAAAAVVAFLPQFLFMSGVANNDALANAAGAVATLAAVRVVLGRNRRRDLVFLGAAVGVALLAKLTTLALAAVAVLAVAGAAWRARSWRVAARAALWSGGTLALVAGWWFARNVWVNGDLLDWGGFTRAAEAITRTRPLAADLPMYFLHQWQSFVGRFGWMAVPLPYVLYRLFALLLVLAGLGLAALALRRWRRPGEPDSPLRAADSAWGVALLVSTVALVYASVFRLAFTFDLVVAQGRYLFPGLAAFAVLFVLGLVGWWPARRRPAGAAVLAAAWCALGVYGLVGALVPAFALPPAVTGAELAGVPHRVDVAFDPWLRLVGYALAPERVAPGDTVVATLYFRPTGQPDIGLWLGTALIDGRGEGAHDRVPAGGSYPATSWVPGRTWREVVRLRVPAASAGASPGPSGMVLTWYPDGWGGEPLPVKVDGHDAGVSFTLGPLYVVPDQPPDPARTPQPRGDTWRAAAGGPAVMELAAAGVVPLPATAGSGRGLAVRLRWHAAAALPPNVAAFVHLEDPDGHLVATADSDPAGLPSALWRAGDDFVSEHDLSLAGLPIGTYRLRVGLYDRASGARLPAYGRDGARWPEDAAGLGTVTVGYAGTRFRP